MHGAGLTLSKAEWARTGSTSPSQIVIPIVADDVDLTIASPVYSRFVFFFSNEQVKHMVKKICLPML